MIASLFNLAGPDLLIIAPFVIFWIWMLIDCAKNERGIVQVGWILVIMLGGALIYLFCRMLPRSKPWVMR